VLGTLVAITLIVTVTDEELEQEVLSSVVMAVMVDMDLRD
jgi:hypothetical protein